MFRLIRHHQRPRLGSSLCGFIVVWKLGEEVIIEVVIIVPLISVVRRFIGAVVVALLPQILAEHLSEARGRARRLQDVSYSSTTASRSVAYAAVSSVLKASLAAISVARSLSGKRSRAIYSLGGPPLFLVSPSLAGAGFYRWRRRGKNMREAVIRCKRIYNF
jgi:hypothetical protein